MDSDFVSGECPDRSEKLKKFREKKSGILANSMLLTEGWDEPGVDCIVVLRPTRSRALYSQMIGRGTRIHPGKENLLILDFLWHVERHNLVKAAHLVAGNEKEANAITRIIESGGGKQLDLIDVKASAEHEREESLRRELEKQAKRKGNQVDPVEFALNLHAQSLIDFEPTMSWHYEPASQKQKETIEQFGVSTAGMLKGQASALLDVVFSRRKMSLASPKQLKWLIKKNHPSPHTCTFEDAKKFLDDSFSGNIRNTKDAYVSTYRIPKIGEEF
jgi:type I site-specific restriction endonuclease